MPEHLSVVEELDEEWMGSRFRARCETCPWAVAVDFEDEGYARAMVHFEYAADRARLAELVEAAS